MKEKVTYVRDGSYEKNAMLIIEKRNGVSCYCWHGYFDGGTLIRMYPVRPYGNRYDKGKRRAMTLSIFEVKREE